MMVHDECIDETMNEWPSQWFGKSKEAAIRGPKILQSMCELWRLIEQEKLSDPERELHFRALWVMGFELSRDCLLSRHLPKLPVRSLLPNLRACVAAFWIMG